MKEKKNHHFCMVHKRKSVSFTATQAALPKLNFSVHPLDKKKKKTHNMRKQFQQLSLLWSRLE